MLIIIIIKAVISIVPYFTDKGEHTALYMVNKDAYIKSTQKKKNLVVLICVCSVARNSC